MAGEHFFIVSIPSTCVLGGVDSEMPSTGAEDFAPGM